MNIVELQRWQHESYERGFAERFWLRVQVQKDDQCWPWLLGTMSYHGRTVPPTHAMWYIATGCWPADMFVCHNCDNPKCVRFEHCFLGTAQDNTDDMIRKERGYWQPRAPHKQLRRQRTVTPV